MVSRRTLRTLKICILCYWQHRTCVIKIICWKSPRIQYGNESKERRHRQVEWNQKGKKYIHFIDFKSSAFGIEKNSMNGWACDVNWKIRWNFSATPFSGTIAMRWHSLITMERARFNEAENIFIEKMQSDRENSVNAFMCRTFSRLPNLTLPTFDYKFSVSYEGFVYFYTDKHRTQAKLHQNHTLILQASSA